MLMTSSLPFRVLALAVLCLFAVLAFPSHAQAQGTGTVTGYVKDRNGAAVAGATVHIGTKSAVTDSTGHYSLSLVPAGSATVTTTKTGWTFGSVVCTVPAGGTVQTADIVGSVEPIGKPGQGSGGG